MKQVFFLLVALFLSLKGAWANESFFSSPCGTALIEAELSLKYSLTDEKSKCLLKHKDFLEAKVDLCNETKPSAKLQKYLEHQIALQNAFEKFRNAKTLADRTIAQYEMNIIERDWSLFGYRLEVSEKLNLIGHAEYECRSDQ